MARKKYIPRDITINGERFIEVSNNTCTSNGAIPECGGRSCHFYRRGECWINEYTKNTQECRWPYIWQKVNNDGYVVDRDGRNLWNTRIDAERYRIDENGNRYTYRTLWHINSKRKAKYYDDPVKY